MQIAVATSARAETRDAAAEALAQIRAKIGESLHFVAVHMNAVHSAEGVRAAADAAGIGMLHGGTSYGGIIGSAGRGGELAADLGIFAIHDPLGDYGTAVAPLANDPRAAASAATRRALARAGREGETPDLIWLTAVPGAESEILAGIAEVVGDRTPVIGGTAADNDLSGRWSVFGTDGGTATGVAVSVLFPSRPVSLAHQGGYAPNGHRGAASRVEGRRIVEIDGRPASDVYAEWTGGTLPVRTADGPVEPVARGALRPFGRRRASVADVAYYSLALPVAANPDGSIELLAEVEQGEILTLMHGAPDSLAARAGRVARLARDQLVHDGGTPGGTLMVHSAGCLQAVGDRLPDLLGGVAEAMGDTPFLGIFSFGEQGNALNGQNSHGNLMICCVSFSA